MKWWWLPLLLVLGQTGQATVLQDLFVARVAVTSQSREELATASRIGLREILVRSSGSSVVAEHPAVLEALRRPQDYYSSYSYDAPRAEDPPDTRWLRLQFDPEAVHRLLRNAGFPVWGDDRPGTLVWLAVEDPERRILGDEIDQPLIRALRQHAERRGLPLIFPLLDLEDSAALTPSMVWEGFETEIDAASTRYNPEVILSGLVQPAPDGSWTASWLYRVDQEWQRLTAEAPTAEHLLAQVIDALADQMASRYAVDASSNEVRLRVLDVKRLKDYAGLLAYLEGLEPVEAVEVERVTGPEIQFRLRTQGRIEQLVETIALESFLQPEPQTTDAPIAGEAATGVRPTDALPATGNELRYRWVPLDAQP